VLAQTSPATGGGVPEPPPAPVDVWETDERRALRALARAFTTREIVPHLPDWERAQEVPRELHRRAAAAGLLGIGFPEQAGGTGGNAIDVAVLTEELIHAGGTSGLCAALLTHGIALPHLINSAVALGNQDLIERFARPTLAGDLIGSLAVTEPDGGSDVASLRTRAERDGDDFVVNGTKTFITSGARADFVTTAVRTGGPGHAGISLLVIPTDTPGFSVVRRLEKMGWHCSDTAELAFVDCRVPSGNLIGAEGSAFVQIAQNFAGERLGLATQAHATAQRCLDLTVAYARARVVFGKPLIAKQTVRHTLVEMARQIELARTYTHAVLARSAHGEQVPAEAAQAKNAAVAACDFVVDKAVQLHGGFGYLRDAEVERHYRDSRILGIGGGATEVMNDLIAKAYGW
jgi:acyl-CoA dehydrogenase